jgi:hypothetical protein
MVCEYKDRMRTAFEVMVPFSQGSDYCEQFSIKDLIVSFCGVQGLGKIAAWVVYTIFVSL